MLASSHCGSGCGPDHSGWCLSRGVGWSANRTRADFMAAYLVAEVMLHEVVLQVPVCGTSSPPISVQRHPGAWGVTSLAIRPAGDQSSRHLGHQELPVDTISCAAYCCICRVLALSVSDGDQLLGQLTHLGGGPVRYPLEPVVPLQSSLLHPGQPSWTYINGVILPVVCAWHSSLKRVPTLPGDSARVPRSTALCFAPPATLVGHFFAKVRNRAFRRM